MKELQQQLNQLWAGKINKLDFNLLASELKISITVLDNQTTTNYDITFKEVSAYYFVNNDGESRKNFYEVEQGDYLELTSIDYFPEGVGEITLTSAKNDWARNYYSGANFALEFWSSILFLESNVIEINKTTFGNLLSLNLNREKRCP